MPTRGPDGRFQPQAGGEAPPPAAGEAPRAPQFADDTHQVTLNYKGQQTVVPVSKAKELAQKGLDYEKEMARLKEQRGDFEAYQGYRAYLGKNQDLAVVIGDVMQTYEQTGKVPRIVLDDGALQTGEHEVPRGIAQLTAQQRRVQDWIAGVEQEKRVEKNMAVFNAVIDGDPVLKELSVRSIARHGTDLVLQKLVDHAVADPQADPQMIGARVATELRMITETLGAGSYADRKEADRQRYASEPPTGTPAPPAAPKAPTPMTKDDLHSGAVAKKALNFIRKRFAELRE